MGSHQRFSVERVEAITNPAFDYASLSPPVAKFLKGQADRIRRQCATSIIQIGKALIEAKRHVSHGAFLSWVESEVSIPARTAQAYMRVAGWASGKGPTVAHLPPSILYLLSSSSTPESFVHVVMARVEAGEEIPISRLREELKTARSAAQQTEPRPAVLGKTPSRLQLQSDDSCLGLHREALAELVSILVQGLNPVDLARVQDILRGDMLFTGRELISLIESALSPNISPIEVPE
ncbi:MULTISPECIES: DUF3102 domain-containing protein [unclassified Bradyrhizobium]|uniref:DUF3102 domain-containing protein n=1 Tax=Bradyrhizobium TaxID=374 RepID=UPI0024E15F7E|nr:MULTISPECIES: DUF3102 domain-containing protein [unclassified Bradyrhizobium]